jgi:RimJ/RimL family protein N-acetyltransferase
MPVILETERLVLRKFNINDAPFIVELLNTPTWLQFIGDRGIRTLAHAQSYLINGPLLGYATYGFGLYMVELKETKAPIGMCGLVKRAYLDDLDLGYALLPQFEGKGYAYEIAMATVNYAFTQLHLLRLAAITLETNKRSVQLLQRMGFIFKETIEVEKEELMLFVKEAL